MAKRIKLSTYFRRKRRKSADGRLGRWLLFGYSAYALCASASENPTAMLGMMAIMHDPVQVRQALSILENDEAGKKQDILAGLKSVRRKDRAFYEGYAARIGEIEKTVSGFFDGKREVEIICSRALSRESGSRKQHIKGMVIEEGNKLWLVLGHDQITQSEKSAHVPSIAAMLCARFSISQSPGLLTVQTTARLNYVFAAAGSASRLRQMDFSSPEAVSDLLWEGFALVSEAAIIEGTILGFKYSLRHHLDERAYALAPDKDAFVNMLARAAQEHRQAHPSPPKALTRRYRIARWARRNLIGVPERSPQERFEYFRKKRAAELGA